MWEVAEKGFTRAVKEGATVNNCTYINFLSIWLPIGLFQFSYPFQFQNILFACNVLSTVFYKLIRRQCPYCKEHFLCQQWRVQTAYLFQASDSSQRWFLTAFQERSIFWPTSQPGLASKAACASPGSATSKTTLGHCRRWGDTGHRSGGAGGVTGGDTASVQAAARGGRNEIWDVVELLVLQWDSYKGQGRRNRNIRCPLRSGGGRMVTLQMRAVGI